MNLIHLVNFLDFLCINESFRAKINVRLTFIIFETRHLKIGPRPSAQVVVLVSDEKLGRFGTSDFFSNNPNELTVYPGPFLTPCTDDCPLTLTTCNETMYTFCFLVEMCPCGTILNWPKAGQAKLAVYLHIQL